MVQLNDRWYRWLEDDKLEEVMVSRIKNSEVSTIIFTKGPNLGELKKINNVDLENNYTKLKPDGYLTFSVVTTGKDTTDVMVTVSTHKDILSGIQLPYAVCRQGAIDLFAKQLSPDNVDYVGVSISRDTCPADVDFANFFACNGVSYSEVMSYYIGNNLQDCIKLIKKKKIFNDTLKENFNKHCLYLANGNRFISDVYKNKEEVDGYCKNLDTLLSLNNFAYDVNAAFGIISTDLTEDDFSEETLSGVAMEVIGSILRIEIGKSIAIKYDKDVDLSKIKRNYCLVSDINNTIYVVAYTVVGRYIVPIEGNESKENIDKLAKVLPAESLQMAYQHIKFNSDKYKEDKK